jgi:hypothetical protein
VALVILPVDPAGADWSGWTGLGIPLRNRAVVPLELSLQVTDRGEAAHRGMLQAHAVLAPAETAVAFLPLNAPSPRSFGMFGEPPPPQGLGCDLRMSAALSGRLDQRQVGNVILRVRQNPEQRLTFDIGAPVRQGWNAGHPAYERLVDRFGQPTRQDTAETIHTVADLQRRAAAGDGPVPAPLALDAYGGFTTGRAFPASGFFRARKADGRWWLVTPEGHRFFSTGVDLIEPRAGLTYVEGREFMFDGLPGKDDPLTRWFATSNSHVDDWYRRGRAFDHGRSFNFYGANLERTFGADWRGAWQERVKRRLAAWDFNTVGAWSAPEFTSWAKLPYGIVLYVNGDYPSIPSTLADKGALPDVFDPRFRAALERAIRSGTADHRDDPYLIGYYVDNELPWGRSPLNDPRRHYASAIDVLRLDGDRAAKRALVVWLREKYQDINLLRPAWHVNVQSWDAFEREPVSLPDPITAGAVSDLASFTRFMAENYYRMVSETIHKEDPNHLYLGSRLNLWLDEVVDACARHCDVISVNLYSRHPTAPGFERLPSIDKPVLLTEFHFGSTDTGFLDPGLVDVGTDAERGPAYRTYVTEAATSPFIVGAHWFQYVDQPVSGRLRDGEDSHIGLVSAADVPYGRFVAVVADTNRRALERLEHFPR